MVNPKEFINLSNITGEKVAVGVSGGADSLALILLLDELLRPLGRHAVALTVDHGLRKESRAEAEYVAKLMAVRGIEHHILTWDGDKPLSGIEEAARLARYALLKSWCEENGVETLCIAHHHLDQAETFLIRLQRGSGLTGLCGMAEVSFLGGLRIVRPLLEVSPEILKEYLRGQAIDWVEDPSNQNEDFLRCRMRKFLPVLEKMTGISSRRMTDTMKVLARSRDYIREQTDRFIADNVIFWENAGSCLALNLLAAQHEELIYQVLQVLIKKFGGNAYAPRAEDINRLAEKIKNGSLTGATLGHCEIFVSRRKIWFIPELKLKKKLPKKIWSDFKELFPVYQKVDLPYKLRAVLVKTKMSIEF